MAQSTVNSCATVLQEMRVIIVVAAFAAVVQTHPISHEDKERLYNYHKDCLLTSGIDEKTVEDSRQGIYSEDPKFKEYIYCFSRKIGFQDEAGILQREVIKTKLGKQIEKEEVDKIVEKCALDKDTPKETAYNTFRCYHENTPKYSDIFYVISLDAEKLEKLKRYQKECADETKIDEKLVKDARKGVFSDEPILKTYTLCMTKKFGFQNAEGALQHSVIKEKLTDALKQPSKAEKLIEACVAEKDTPEESAFSMMKCLCEKSHLNFLQTVILAPEKLDKLLAFSRECLTETSVEKALVDAAKQGNFAEDDKLKEYFFCMGKKAGFQNEKGELQKEVFRQKLSEVLKDPVVSQQLIEKCAVEKSSPQETAYSSVRCYYENSSGHISIFQVAALSDEQRQKLMKFNEECKTESGLEPETMEQLKKGIFAEDEKLKKHLLCFHKKVGFQSDSGDIQRKIISEKFGKLLGDAAVSENLAEKCAIQKDLPEDTAYGSFVCYYENTASHFNIFSFL